MTKQLQKETPKFQRLPPQSTDIEEGVLGAIMLDKEAMYVVIDILQPSTFYDPRNQVTYEACLSLFAKQHPIDSFTVMEEMRAIGTLERSGGPARLAEITLKIASSANLEYHCRIIQQYDIRRQLIRAAMEIERDAYDESIDGIEEGLQNAEQKIFGISQGINRGVQKSKSKLALSAMQNLDFILDNPGKITGVCSGFERLDKYTLGFQRQELTLIAARPMMGKTTVALEIALNAAQSGSPVCFFSLGDMSAEELTEKAILMIAEVPFVNVRERRVTTDQRKSIAEAAERYVDIPLHIYDLKSLGSSEFSSIRSMSRKMVATGVELIVIDYIQQISHSGLRERMLVDQVSKDLKQMASLLDVPVVALSQLSRAVETRGGSKRPQLSDLRESGSLEQDANSVFFVYRPEYYGIKEDEQGGSTIGITELICAKFRKSGDLRTITLIRDPATGRLKGEEQTAKPFSNPDERITSNYDPMISGFSKMNDDKDIPF